MYILWIISRTDWCGYDICTIWNDSWCCFCL